MSLPGELRLLCHQLSSTPSAQLPNTIPTLLRNVLCCQGPLSSGGSESTKFDPSESSVLVHKLKTQISTLLYGKSTEGRFTAVVLIKAIVAVGGWQVLQGVESWVRGLLSILGKQDPDAAKRLCILSLTSIYLLTHQYQSLVREVTTPTLPNFVSSCLSLISPKTSARALEVPYSLVETIFESFFVLISRHPTIFRPYGNQIKVVVRPYLAPTSCDRYFVPLSLSQSAQRVAVLLYQTSAKNTGGEEWGKGIRELVKGIHATTDQVYRAVIEDWESAAGYVSQAVDVNKEAHGGAKSEDDLPAWRGIDAGIQRLEGMLRLLKEHFMHQTATSVNVSLDLIVDLLTRLTSVVSPTNAKSGSNSDGVRLHPAIERSERDGLWSGLENIHVVSMEVYLVLVNRLQYNFISLAQRCLSQVSWIFLPQHHDETFRCVVYQLLRKILPLCGSNLDQSAVTLLTVAIKTCCEEFPISEDGIRFKSHDDSGKSPRNGSSINTNTFLGAKAASETGVPNGGSEVLNAARELLPIFLSHLPQHHLQGYLRAKIDQTAILTRNKEAMLASVLNPYLGKNGRILPSILPHLCRGFPDDPAVEALLRPRLPVLIQNQASSHVDVQLIEDSLQEVDELMVDVVDNNATLEDIGAVHTYINYGSVSGHQAPEKSNPQHKVRDKASHDNWGGSAESIHARTEPAAVIEEFSRPLPPPAEPNKAKQSQKMPDLGDEDEGEDSDESVHLIMDLSDSEHESVA